MSLTTKEFARAIGVSEKTVHNKISNLEITDFSKVKGRLYFETNAVLNYLSLKYPKLISNNSGVTMQQRSGEPSSNALNNVVSLNVKSGCKYEEK